MTDLHPRVVVSPGDGEDRWRFLYRTAAIAALVTVVLFLFQIVAFFVWPPPTTVIGHFNLLQTRPVIGLLSLDFLIIVDEVLAIPICLALYMSLRRFHESIVLIGSALSAVSIVCFLIATPALNMLYLSHQYAAAASAADRDGLVGAGQAVLSAWFGTPFQVGNVIGAIGMILISYVMWRSLLFGRFTASMGIVAGALGIGMYVPSVGVYISILSVVGMQVWYVLIALTLLRVSKVRPMQPIPEEGQKAEGQLVRLK